MSMLVPEKDRPLCIPVSGTTGSSQKPDMVFSGNEFNIIASSCFKPCKYFKNFFIILTSGSREELQEKNPPQVNDLAKPLDITVGGSF